MTVGERGEHALLRWLRETLPPGDDDVVVGIGDDAAVLRAPSREWLVQTTDALVDGVHVLSGAVAPHDIGRRAVAVNLSDLAAMAARPAWVLLSLVLPDRYAVADFEALVRGASDQARAHGALIVGGNLTRTPGPLVVDVTATGYVRPRRLLRRDTARPGDELWVTGAIGAAAAGLDMLRRGVADHPCVQRYAVPAPRVREALAMARTKAARAAIDVSDGLADAVRQLAAASGTGATIDAAALPLDGGARAWWTAHSADALDASVGDSDDYEVLFAVPPKSGGRLRAARAAFATPLTRIGTLTSDVGTCVWRRDGRDVPLPTGFAHFARP